MVLFLTETREAAVYVKENRLLAKGKTLVKTDFATMYTSLSLERLRAKTQSHGGRCQTLQDQSYSSVQPVRLGRPCAGPSTTKFVECASPNPTNSARDEWRRKADGSPPRKQTSS